MILSANAFSLLVVAAVIVTSAIPVVLILLFLRDLKKGMPW